MAYYYSQTVRCGGCGTHLRIVGDGQDQACGSTDFVVSCPNCQRDVSCEAPRPVAPTSVQVCWYQQG